MSEFDAKYAKECVQLEATNLQGEFVKYTADLAHWGEVVAACRQGESMAKLTRDAQAADLDAIARETLIGDKKPTEASIHAWVTRHPAMQSAETQLVEATYRLDQAKAVYDALRSKRDMLVGLGAQQRAEMQHDPSLKMEF